MMMIMMTTLMMMTTITKTKKEHVTKGTIRLGLIKAQIFLMLYDDDDNDDDYDEDDNEDDVSLIRDVFLLIF